MYPLHTLCVQLPAQKVLIAAADGRCWLTALNIPKVTALPISALAAKRSSFGRQ